MSYAGYAPQNHPLYGRGAQNEVDDRRTPAEVFDPLHGRWDFTIDAAASEANALLPRYWTAADDGLAQSWAGERVWCNPPYSRIRPWLVKAWREQSAAGVVVMLLPSNRTDQPWEPSPVPAQQLALGDPA